MTTPHSGIFTTPAACQMLAAAALLMWAPIAVRGQQPSASAREQAADARPAAPAASGSPHVRGCDATSIRLLEQGRLRSPTVARLLAALDQSDVYVHVRTGFLRAPGMLQFVATTRGGRFLRITVTVPDADVVLIAALAHELQHALEVASAPAVTDNASLLRYYERHGQRIASGEYCTCEAQKTNGIVRYELAVSLASRR